GVASETLAEVCGDLWVLGLLDAEGCRDGLASNVVGGAAEAAGNDDQVGTVGLLAQGRRDLVDLVGHDRDQADLDAGGFEPPCAQRRSWLALESGEVLGFATSAVKWDEPGVVGRFWIGVRPDRRRCGIGAALYDLAERHARAIRVQRLTVEVDDDPDGRRF